ncbi:tyrosine-type recombinase/integrase [Kroppenstedtia pulmonis]|nr:tyrosine-type recombinase/integrase [Kroppenstedtia pulmonis]
MGIREGLRYLQTVATFIEKNGHITPHSFRHTHALLLIEANVNPKVISHRLGHSTTEEVERSYGYLTRGIEKKASQQFNELMKDLLDLE